MKTLLIMYYKGKKRHTPKLKQRQSQPHIFCLTYRTNIDPIWPQEMLPKLPDWTATQQGGDLAGLKEHPINLISLRGKKGERSLQSDINSSIWKWSNWGNHSEQSPERSIFLLLFGPPIQSKRIRELWLFVVGVRSVLLLLLLSELVCILLTAFHLSGNTPDGPNPPGFLG